MFDGKNWRVFQELLNSDLGVQMILTIPDGTVWFAMSMNGIYSYDGKSWRHYTKADGLIHDWVEGVAMSPDGVLWVTSCYGITEFDGKNWKNDEKGEVDGEGFPVNCVAGNIVVDQSGVVWISTANGLLRI